MARAEAPAEARALASSALSLASSGPRERAHFAASIGRYVQAPGGPEDEVEGEWLDRDDDADWLSMRQAVHQPGGSAR